MRPSRIIVGEVRQEESLDLLIALNSGLPGMCTMHANCAREAVTKMCTLPLLAGENVGTRSSCRPSPACVDLVVHVGTERDGRRAGARDRGAARPRRGRRRRDRRRLHHPRRPAGPGRRATRRTPTGSTRAGFDLARLLVAVRHRGLAVGALRGSAVRARAAAGLALFEPPAPRSAGPRRPAGTRRATCSPQAGMSGINAAQLLASCSRRRRRRAGRSCTSCRARRRSRLAFAVMASLRAGRCWCGAAPGSGGPSCARCGRRSSTTWPPACGPGCRCPRR